MDGINFNLHTNDLSRIFVKLKHLHEEYASHFRSKTRNVATQALQYLQGKFLEKGCGNMTRYARNATDSNNQSMQNCISDSPWDVRPVIDHIKEGCNSTLETQKTAAAIRLSHKSQNTED